MKESGAQDDSWHNPEGKFDWGNVKSLDFSWENGYVLECDIWFDEIEITNKGGDPQSMMGLKRSHN
jgi:hypothetical protein